MGFAVSLALLVIGAFLTVTVGSPTSGVNLQTAGLMLMLAALTGLNIAMAAKERTEGHRRTEDLDGAADR